MVCLAWCWQRSIFFWLSVVCLECLNVCIYIFCWLCWCTLGSLIWSLWSVELNIIRCNCYHLVFIPSVPVLILHHQDYSYGWCQFQSPHYHGVFIRSVPVSTSSTFPHQQQVILLMQTLYHHRFMLEYILVTSFNGCWFNCIWFFNLYYTILFLVYSAVVLLNILHHSQDCFSNCISHSRTTGIAWQLTRGFES